MVPDHRRQSGDRIAPQSGTIVIVDSSVAVTGGLRAAAGTARLLAPWAATIIALPEHARIPESELTDFAEVVRLPVRQIRKSPRDLAMYLPALLQSGWRLSRLLNRTGASTLIINDFNQMQGWAARLFGYKGRLLTFVRRDPTQFPRALADFWLDITYRVSDHVLAVADHIAGKIPPSPKLRTVYDPLNLDFPIGLHARPRSAARDVVQVANYIPDKGQEHVLEAFARIAPRHPNSRLLFHGGDLGLEKNLAFRRRLEERARQLGLAEQVRFFGFAQDVPGALESAALVCNLSKSEALSYACIEASQLGIPVVAFRSGGPEEIIVDGRTGYLCELGDVECVAGRIDELLTDPAKATAMGRAGVEHVSAKYGPAPFIAAMRKLLAI